MTTAAPCRLAVSIINFRTPALSWACVESLLRDIGARQDVAIVVVDNASGDGSADFLADRIAALPAGVARPQLIRSPVNGGFSAGHNLGIAAMPADWHLVLNSDAAVQPGFTARMLAAMDGAGADIGLLAPRIIDSEGRPQQSRFRFPSVASEVIRGAASGPVTRLLGRWDVPLYGEVPDDAIGWASFAAIALRARMIDRIGPLDDGYFMYFEDIDYCLRARRAGWRIAAVPGAVVTHDEGGSGDLVENQRAGRRLPAYYYASRTRYFTKALGWPGYVAANLGWGLGRGLSLIRPMTGRPRPPVRPGEARGVWLNAMRPTGDRHAPN